MLRLGGLEVTRLSGPASFNYLVPKKEAFEENAANGTFLPIILLLGDIHSEDQQSCEDCEEEKGCYHVDGERFMNAINKIGRVVPVDIYTETFKEEGDGDNYVANSPLVKITRDSEGCRSVVLRKSPSYNCKFRNIRWHHSDTRNTIGKLESDYKDYLEYVKAALEEAIEQPGNSIFSLIDMSQIHGVNIYADENNLLLTLCYALYDSIINNNTFEVFALKLAKMITKSIKGNNESMIYKQLKKVKMDVNIELYIYRAILNQFSQDNDVNSLVGDHMNELFRKTSPLQPSALSVLSTVSEMFRIGGTVERSKVFNVPKYIKMVDIINAYLVNVGVPLLDLYFTLRTLKTPKGNVNSYLSVGFFGASHTDYISNFLVDGLGYYNLVISTQSAREILRNLLSGVKNSICITFDKFIDVDADLERYAEMRQRYEKLSIFSDVLKEEYRSRGESF